MSVKKLPQEKQGLVLPVKAIALSLGSLSLLCTITSPFFSCYLNCMTDLPSSQQNSGNLQQSSGNMQKGQEDGSCGPALSQ